MTGVAATSFPTTVMAVILDVIRDDLRTDLAAISWVQVAPSLAFAMAMPMSGKLGDLYGHRRIYVWGFGIATVFSLLTATAWDAWSLVAFRTISQLGGGATGTAAIALVSSTFVASDRARAIGLINVAGGLAPVLGATLAGPLVDLVSWRMLFILQAVPAAIAWFMSIPVLSETERQENVTFDLAGALSLGLSASAAMFALNRLRPWGFSLPVVIAIAITPVAAMWFVRTEKRVAWPLLPLSYLRVPAFTASILSLLALQTSFLGSFVWAPTMVRRLFDYNTTTISLLVMSRPLGFALGAWTAGRHHSKRSLTKLQMFGNGALIVGSAFMVVGPLERSMILIQIGLIMTGFSNGYARTVIFSFLTERIPAADIGITSAVANMMTQLGNAVGTAMLAAIIAESAEPATMAWAFGSALVVALFTVPATRIFARR